MQKNELGEKLPKYERTDEFDGFVEPNFWTDKRAEKGSVEFSSEVARSGSHSLKFTLKPGDKLATDIQGKKSERCEIGEIKEQWVPAETEIWYAFSLYLPEDFVTRKNRLVVAQWKQVSEVDYSPFLSFRVYDGKLIQTIKAEGQNDNITVVNEKPLAAWSDIKVNYKFNMDGTGKISSIVNGINVAEYDGVLGFERDGDRTYFKMGLYRDPIPAEQTIYFDRFKRSSQEPLF